MRDWVTSWFSMLVLWADVLACESASSFSLSLVLSLEILGTKCYSISAHLPNQCTAILGTCNSLLLYLLISLSQFLRQFLHLSSLGRQPWPGICCRCLRISQPPSEILYIHMYTYGMWVSTNTHTCMHTARAHAHTHTCISPSLASPTLAAWPSAP